LGFVNVGEGDHVKAGEWLMGLNTGDLDAAAQAAYYRYLAADANAKQIEDAVKGHDSDETFAQKTARVTAQTTRDMAYDAWLSARRALDYAVLKAPFDGVAVGITSNVVGNTVGVTDGLMVVDPSKLYFEVDVDETDMGKVSVGQAAEVSLDAFPGQKIKGSVTSLGFVSKISSSGATVYPVRVELPKEWLPKLLLGLNGDANLILDVAKNTLSLPSDVIVNGEVTMAGKDVRKVKVKTGLVGDTDTQILEGLNEGDKVVTK
jgi:HlyD family secretion protein